MSPEFALQILQEDLQWRAANTRISSKKVEQLNEALKRLVDYANASDVKYIYTGQGETLASWFGLSGLMEIHAVRDFLKSIHPAIAWKARQLFEQDHPDKLGCDFGVFRYYCNRITWQIHQEISNLQDYYTLKDSLDFLLMKDPEKDFYHPLRVALQLTRQCCGLPIMLPYFDKADMGMPFPGEKALTKLIIDYIDGQKVTAQGYC